MASCGTQVWLTVKSAVPAVSTQPSLDSTYHGLACCTQVGVGRLAQLQSQAPAYSCCTCTPLVTMLLVLDEAAIVVNQSLEHRRLFNSIWPPSAAICCAGSLMLFNSILITQSAHGQKTLLAVVKHASTKDGHTSCVLYAM